MREYDMQSAMREKMQAAANQCASNQETMTGSTVGGLGSCGSYPPEPEGPIPFTDRLRSRRGRAERESWKANQIGELLYLLEKNPEVSRILDLIELVGQS